eukprot:scaffold1586_cov126-Skeletonema_dohrnii-CCMP3373.AAC.9
MAPPRAHKMRLCPSLITFSFYRARRLCVDHEFIAVASHSEGLVKRERQGLHFLMRRNHRSTTNAKCRKVLYCWHVLALRRLRRKKVSPCGSIAHAAEGLLSVRRASCVASILQGRS